MYECVSVRMSLFFEIGKLGKHKIGKTITVEYLSLTPDYREKEESNTNMFNWLMSTNDNYIIIMLNNKLR